MRTPRTLAIVSAAPHFEWDGRLWSHAPYVREINLWAELFPRVVIVGPLVASRPPGDGEPFTTDNVRAVGVPPTGGDTLRAKLRQVGLLPLLIWRTCKALSRADAVHVRCPGNMGLLGVLLAPLFSRRLVAKYAGQWNGFPGEKWTVRLQRALLGSRWWRGPVTVYGEWPDQPPTVVPFFTSVLTDDQIARAGDARSRMRRQGALRVLFVGRLSGPKNASTLLLAAAELITQGIDLHVTIVGDGAERENLERLTSDARIRDHVDFVGAVGVDDVLDHYEQADTLVLVSESEGWPKAIAEAMTFGLVCIGSDRGMVPQMLGEGRGIAVAPGDHDALAEALGWLAAHPKQSDEMGRRSSEWGRRYSLEGLQRAIAELLSNRWATTIGPGAARVSVLHVTDTLDAGGAERVAVNFVNRLPRDRFVTSLCTTRREGLLAADVADHVGRLDLARSDRIHDLAALRRLTRFLRTQSIDIVHAHSTSLFIAAAARMAVPHTRLVWHDHLGTSTATRRKRRWLYRVSAARADHIITVSHVLEEWARTEIGVAAARVTTIPNFVLPVSIELEQENAPDLPGDAGRRIACVANLRPQKDHINLLAAMAKVVEVHPDAHALLIGAPIDRPLEASIIERVSSLGLDENVTLLGARSDVSTILAGCDVGVLSSRSEGFPLALLDYGRAGLAVVATDVGECREILDSGRAGRLVAPGDADALADALCGLLGEPTAAAALGAELRRRVESRYSIDAVMDRVEHIYDTILDVRR